VGVFSVFSSLGFLACCCEALEPLLVIRQPYKLPFLSRSCGFVFFFKEWKEEKKMKWKEKNKIKENKTLCGKTTTLSSHLIFNVSETF
jgi:hypothetical protein